MKSSYRAALPFRGTDLPDAAIDAEYRDGLASFASEFRMRPDRMDADGHSTSYRRKMLSDLRPMPTRVFHRNVHRIVRLRGAAAAVAIVRRMFASIFSKADARPALKSPAEEITEAVAARAEFTSNVVRFLADGELDRREAVALEELNVRAEMEESDLHRFAAVTPAIRRQESSPK
jgi:hypothetical protein